jgi:hypothetical protein
MASHSGLQVSKVSPSLLRLGEKTSCRGSAHA